MTYTITDKARKSPILISSPLTKEMIGVGGEYVENLALTGCASCDEEVHPAKGKVFREATEEEYQLICNQYIASNGIPGYLIITKK